jgi:hypothetical protein
MMTEEQLKAYKRFIRARDEIKLVKTKTNRGKPYVAHRDFIDSIHITDLNHPLFVVNDLWIEYKEASLAWWAIEPRYREEERLRATRGDYGDMDNWDEPSEVEELDTFFKGEK